MAKTSRKSNVGDIFAKYATNKELAMVPISVDALNAVWGGGIALGYMYSMWGEAGCGKSTLAMQIVKSFCKKGKRVLIIDIEKAMNELQLKAFGLYEYTLDGTLVILTVVNFGELEEIVDAVIESGEFSLVVLDSETAVNPVTPAGLKVTDVRPGLRSQQESFVLNKMKNGFYSKGIASLVLFHARANIQIMGGNPYTPQTKQAGGFAAVHYPDIVTQISTHGKLKDDAGNITGVEITIQTTKNKFCKPFQPLRKKLFYGIGISKRIDLVDTCIEKGLIVQKGSYFDLPNGERIRGRQDLYNLPVSTLKDLQRAIEGDVDNSREEEPEPANDFLSRVAATAETVETEENDTETDETYQESEE